MRVRWDVHLLFNDFTEFTVTSCEQPAMETSSPGDSHEMRAAGPPVGPVRGAQLDALLPELSALGVLVAAHREHHARQQFLERTVGGVGRRPRGGVGVARPGGAVTGRRGGCAPGWLLVTFWSGVWLLRSSTCRFRSGVWPVRSCVWPFWSALRPALSGVSPCCCPWHRGRRCACFR